MEQAIGRIVWDAVEIETDQRESGTTWVRLDDVRVAPKQVTRAYEEITKRLTADSTRLLQSQKSWARRLGSMLRMLKVSKQVLRQPGANDVVEVWYQKSIQLSDKYHIAYAEHVQAEHGFGFSCGIGPIDKVDKGPGHTFSWDWFTFEPGGYAVKLQEAGRIQVDMTTTPCGVEITHMVFASDVSMRISRMGGDPTKTGWRINIHEGSEIRWPSLVDGRLVDNGFLP